MVMFFFMYHEDIYAQKIDVTIVSSCNLNVSNTSKRCWLQICKAAA